MIRLQPVEKTVTCSATESIFMKKPSSPSGIIPPDKFGTAVCEALESIGKNQLLEHRQVQALSLDLTIRTFEVNGMPKKKKLMWPRLALHDRNELFYRHSEKTTPCSPTKRSMKQPKNSPAGPIPESRATSGVRWNRKLTTGPFWYTIW